MADKPAQIEVEYLEGMGGVAASQPAEKNPSSLEAAERHPRDGPAPPLRPPSSRAIGTIHRKLTKTTSTGRVYLYKNLYTSKPAWCATVSKPSRHGRPCGVGTLKERDEA